MRSQIISAAAALKVLFRECAIQANMFIVIALMLCIFVVDLNTPLGVAAAVPYILVVFSSLWVSGIRFTYCITAMTLILTITGFYLSPGIVMPMNVIVFNRGLTLLLIICSALMVIKIKKTNSDMSTLLTQVLIDPITGYKNRQAFESELDTEILRSRRYHRSFSVAIIDLDLLKLFSDDYDYKNKNDSIKQISHEIKTNIRITDLFYRIDINVFAILFPETDLYEAKKVCESVRKKVSTKMDKNTENKIMVSIGIAMLDETDNKLKLCKRAEDALFAAKRNGGNQVFTLPQIVNKDKSTVPAILSRSRSTDTV